MDAVQHIRELLARQLDWGEAHVGFERALADFPEDLLGVAPPGFAHTGWQFLEHMRRAQADILDFCVNPGYVYPGSLDELWPEAAPLPTSPGRRQLPPSLKIAKRSSGSCLTSRWTCSRRSRQHARRTRPSRGASSSQPTTTHIISANLSRSGGCWASGRRGRAGASRSSGEPAG